MELIRTVTELKRAADEVFADISDSCRQCTDPDCQGYLWVLPQEEDGLLDADIPLVQLNAPSGPTYLDNFRRDEQGGVRIGERGPRCPYLGADGRCGIHERRPLTCHLYPLSLEIRVDGVFWAVHTDCEHIRRTERGGQLVSLIDRLRGLIHRIAPDLAADLLDTMRRVAGVSRVPDYDCYIVLGPLGSARG
jgi:Fe-S-cluster containining protein